MRSAECGIGTTGRAPCLPRNPMIPHSALPPALEAREVTKRFPGVLANDRVSFAVARGEIHALLGENGAGKSTLMNVLYGLYQPDEGQVLVGGEPVRFRSPRDAIARG